MTTMWNFTKNLRDNRAFTLLEMAIVVAIVGLLAGAIVAGQSIVRSSQITAVMTDAKFYYAAFKKFEDQYGAAPGDMSTAQNIWGTVTANGNGDGRIYGATASHEFEMFNAWEHLALSGLIPGVYTGVAGSAGAIHCVPGQNAPQTAVDRVGMQFYDFASALELSGYASYYDGFYYRPLLIGTSYANNNLCYGAFLTPKEAFQLDSKYDDGSPASGSHRVVKSDSACVTSTDPAVALYKTATTVPACRLVLTSQ